MKHLFAMLVAMISLHSYAQNVGIGTKNPQNKLHIAGGLRIDSLAGKKDSGLVLHNKKGDLYSVSLTGKKSDVLRGDGTFAAGPAWKDAWLLTGNAGTDSNTNFLGTLDNQPLSFRINNIPFGGFDRNIFIGYGGPTEYNPTGVHSGSNNVAIGNGSLANSQGTANVSLGFGTMYFSGTGNQNVAIGENAMQYSNGSTNVAIGLRAMSGGFATGSDRWASENTAVGAYALGSNEIGFGNVAVGRSALSSNSIGDLNTAVGFESARSSQLVGHNTAMGVRSLYTNVYGEYNTVIGEEALYSQVSGYGMTAVGYQALYNNQDGFGNTAIGYGADVVGTDLTNATAIGLDAKVNASNKVRIGNASVTVIEGQVPFTTPSDGRFKFNVKEDVGGLDFILKLRPVTYQFDVKKFDGVGDASFACAKNKGYEKAAMIRRTGFIAQEVEKAAEETNYNFSGVIKPGSEKEHYSLSYESFVVPLVKGMQEQQQIISEQNKKIDEQNEKITQLLKRIEQLEKK